LSQEHIAADILRHIKEALPLMKEEDIKMAMRMISADLQGNNENEFREEDESEGVGVAPHNTGTQLLKSFDEHGGFDTLHDIRKRCVLRAGGASPS
jgi:hypothetical protein